MEKTNIEDILFRKMEKREVNPFYKRDNLKKLNDLGAKQTNKNSMFLLLSDAWDKSKDDLTLRQLFFIILFDIGGITNRDHNIFKGKKIDNGGKAAREQFLWILEWMRLNTTKQYYKFLMEDLIRQFVGLLSILIVKIKTKKKTTQIINIENTILQHDINKLVDYYAILLKKANPILKILIFKSLTRVKLSKRQKYNKLKELVGHRNLQDDTLKNMRVKENFYKLLSDKMGWEYLQYPNNIKFIGMNKEKAKYNGQLESVLFSSKKIQEFDKDEFINWLNIQPAGARRRIKTRLVTKDGTSKGKWISKFNNADIGQWYLNWVNFKETAQKEERILQEKKRQGTISEKESVKLEKVKKLAKVTVGGTRLEDELINMLKGNFDNTLIHSVISKIEFQLDIMWVVDISGSMNSNVSLGNEDIQASKVAALFVTLGLLKTPPTNYDDIIMLFGKTSRIVSHKIEGIKRSGMYSYGEKVIVPNLINRLSEFETNFTNMQQICAARNENTRIDSMSQGFKSWVEASNSKAERLTRIEQIKSIPMFIIISDGGFNSHSGPKESLRAFQSDMDAWFGWNGGILIWDIGTYYGTNSKFDSLDNVFHIFGWDLGAINTIFKHIIDTEKLDIYTELNSLYKSNRYELIKEAVI